MANFVRTFVTLTTLISLSVGNPLDCSLRESDDVVATCCDAQSAWSAIEAAGGCGGPAGATVNHCAHATELCERCRAQVEAKNPKQPNVGNETGDMLDQKLSSFDLSFLEMTCLLPQWTPACVQVLTDSTFVALFTASTLLLLLTAYGLVLLDRRVMPCLLGQRLQTASAKEAEAPNATNLGQPHLVPTSDALRLAAAMPAENVQLSVSARGPAMVSALRSVFLQMSSVAVLARIALIVAYVVLLPRQLHVAQTFSETILTLLPLAWCVCRSSPGNLAFCGPGRRCPRFSSVAFLTLMAETYSTIVASMVVATVPCGDSFAWRAVVLYCLGVLVTVVRCYTAVLALRLQDLAAGTCRRVLPQEPDDAVGTGDIQCNVEVEDTPQAPQVDKSHFKSTALAWEEVLANADGNLLCACLPEACCPVLRRRLAGRRWLLQGGICFAVSSAVLSAVVARSVAAAENAAAAGPASSCGVARNATTTCVPWQLAGTHLFDRRTGDLEMDLANTLQDCCGGCDAVDECQAWIFERVAKRCRWIRFEDEVCHRSPEHLGCRCYTHWGTAFGFKATSNLVWLTAT